MSLPVAVHLYEVGPETSSGELADASVIAENSVDAFVGARERPVTRNVLNDVAGKDFSQCVGIARVERRVSALDRSHRGIVNAADPGRARVPGGIRRDVDHDTGFITHDPRVVPGRYVEQVARPDLVLGSVVK